MKFMFGFLVGLLSGVVMLATVIGAFIAGIMLGEKYTSTKPKIPSVKAYKGSTDESQTTEEEVPAA